jgi:hypothetical protein
MQQLPELNSASLKIFATGWTVRESNPGGSEIYRTRPDRSWGPPILLFNGYRVLPGSKAAGPGRAGPGRAGPWR